MDSWRSKAQSTVKKKKKSIFREKKCINRVKDDLTSGWETLFPFRHPKLYLISYTNFPNVALTLFRYVLLKSIVF